MNVVKLDEDSEGSDAPAEKLGMRVIKMPIPVIPQTVGEPPAGRLWCAVDWMEAGGTFVHCLHGQDRTGLAVAMYRVSIDGWSKRDAETEMMMNGFHPWLRGLYWAWQDYVP